MRIRKRQVPLPLSSLSPIPLSDPLFFDRPVQLPPATKPPPPRISPPRPPDGPIVAETDSTDRLAGCNRELTAAEFGNDYASASEEVKGEKSNDSGAPDITGNALGTSSSVLVSAYPSENEAATRWLEEDKASFVPKMRWPSSDDFRDEEYETNTKTKASLGPSGGKRRGRGGGIANANMEGSRCSRVNGRGWRCGQQTLVGYSLCEHHLGKGRLRSMTSVRSSSASGAAAASTKGSEKPQQPTGTDDADPSLVSGTDEVKCFADDNKEEDDDEKVDSAEAGKKKARSMSSLLGQGPDYADSSNVAVVAHVVEGDLRY